MSIPEGVSYRCAAIGCSNCYLKNMPKDFVNKKFFSFPKNDVVRCKKWFDIMGLPYRETRSYLCADHFKDKMFTDSLHRRLFRIALPFNNQVKTKTVSQSLSVETEIQTPAASVEIEVQQVPSSVDICNFDTTESTTVSVQPEIQTVLAPCNIIKVSKI